MKIPQLLKEFIDSEKTGGLILIFLTIFSILASNYLVGESYVNFWHSKVFGIEISHIINDGLMAIFFLLIGLELEREIYIGELSNLKSAMVPIIAAIGGMLVPATLFILMNINTENISGAGIPMATDIAFALGILSILGKKVPTELKVFLTALAVIDDLGAIIIIGIFYSKNLIVLNLIISLSIFGILLLLNKFKVSNLIPYLLGGILMWYFMLISGVHATISGVLLAFAIPFQRGSSNSISYKLQHFLHKPVAFLILPIFALANTAFTFDFSFTNLITSKLSLGIIIGLFIGKPLGIFSFTYIYVKIKKITLSDSLNWSYIFGASIVAGIGFTMSIFIALLAFNAESLINSSKVSILISSFMSGLFGYIYLYFISTKSKINYE